MPCSAYWLLHHAIEANYRLLDAFFTALLAQSVKPWCICILTNQHEDFCLVLGDVRSRKSKAGHGSWRLSEGRHSRKELEGIKSLEISSLYFRINCSLHTSRHIRLFPSSHTTAKMGAEANTDKPHSHHAIPKDIPEDKGLKNEATPGVRTLIEQSLLEC